MPSIDGIFMITQFFISFPPARPVLLAAVQAVALVVEPEQQQE